MVSDEEQQEVAIPPRQRAKLVLHAHTAPLCALFGAAVHFQPNSGYSQRLTLDCRLSQERDASEPAEGDLHLGFRPTPGALPCRALRAWTPPANGAARLGLGGLRGGQSACKCPGLVIGPSSLTFKTRHMACPFSTG